MRCTTFDGVVVNEALEQIPGLRCSSYLAHPEVGLSREDYRPRRSTESVQLIVVHNTVGDWPIEIRPGRADDGDLAERNAIYWRRSKRESSTQLIVDQDGTVICTADLLRVAAYGAGHPRGNGCGINVEMAALPTKGKRGSVLYQGQIEDTATLCNWLAERFCVPKVATAPRPRGREYVEALARKGSVIRGLCDHCALSRRRGIGDTGFLVQAELVRLYGWSLQDWDK